MEPAASSWTVLRCLKFAVYGAVCARITVILIRRYREASAPKGVDKWTLNDVSKHIENAKDAAKQAKEELKDKVVATTEQLAEDVEAIHVDISEAISEFTEDLKQKLLSAEVREALDTIQYLIENVRQFDMGSAPYESSVVLLLALLRRVQEERELPAWEEELPQETSLGVEQAVSINKMATYALNTYSASWSSSEEKMAVEMGVEPEDVVFTWCRDEEGGICPKFIILLDHESEAIVLAIRGTFCLKDVILDMVCDDAPFLEGFAHKGIREGAERVWANSCSALLAALALHPTYSLVLTGHSLGGGVAVLLALELLAGDGAAHLPPGTQVCCLALAPPPVYRAKSSWLWDTSLPAVVRERVQILVNRHDCIPRMSLGSLARLVASLRAVDGLGISLGDALSALALGEKGAEVRARVGAALASVQQEAFPYLQHPGTILYLEPRGEERYAAVPQDSERFTELLMVDDMLTDHRKDSYQEAVQRLTRTVLHGDSHGD